MSLVAAPALSLKEVSPGKLIVAVLTGVFIRVIFKHPALPAPRERIQPESSLFCLAGEVESLESQQ